MSSLDVGSVHVLIITSDGSTLETAGDAEFHYAPASVDGDWYVELHIDVDFGVLGRTLTVSLPAPAFADLHRRLQGDHHRRRNLRIVEP